MTIASFSPLADVLALREAMDRLFDRPSTIKITANSK